MACLPTALTWGRSMKVKTSELIGTDLDRAVVKAQGFAVYHNALLGGHIMRGFWVSGYYPKDLNNWRRLDTLRYSTDWAQGGPIIEQEKISIYHTMTAEHWIATLYVLGERTVKASGPTSLIAAMRCFVTSKIDEEVELPGLVAG